MDVNIIFGPPGTGKTHRLMDILSDELKQYAPEEIAYVSFTREGAYQGRNRAIEEFGFTQAQFPFFRTLHSMAFSSLNLRRGDVIGKKDYKRFSDAMGMKFTGYYTEDLRNDDDKYLFFIDLHRNNQKTAQVYLNSMDISKVNFVRNNYVRFKQHSGKIDYTDMIEQFNKENRAVPVKVAFIDEAQDLTTLQWRMVWTAFKDCDKIYIAGDDDQAIYQWSGADVNYFLGIEGNMEVLHHSWRVPNNLLRTPRAITSLISKRVEKQYDGIEKPGKLLFLNNFTDVKINDDETWLILSRNNYFLKNVEDWIRSQGFIYSRRGTVSASKEMLDAIKLYTSVSRSKMMDKSQELTLSKHLKARYNLNDPWYNSFNWSPEELMYYRDIIANKTDINKCNIKIGTIHSAKGDEADNVILLSDITRTVKANLDNNPDSEHRCFYVGVTRTKKNLFIVNPMYKYSYTLFWLGGNNVKRK